MDLQKLNLGTKNFNIKKQKTKIKRTSFYHNHFPSIYMSSTQGRLV